MFARRQRTEANAGSPRVVAGAIALVLAAGVLLAALGGGGWFLLRARGGPWVLSACGSRLFVVHAAIVLACGLALVLIGCMLHAAGAPHRRVRSRGRDGTAALEFAIALPVALGLALVMLQSSLLMVGNLCVHYAAFCAARSAIVHVPVDRTPGEPMNEVAAPDDSWKRLGIGRAAAWAVMPVSCGHPDAPGGEAAELVDGLDAFFGRYGRETPKWVLQRLDRRVRYAEDHTRVELAPPVDGRQAYDPHENIRVTVAHDFYLSIPYAARLFAVLSRDGVELDFGNGEYGTVIRASCTLPNEGAQDYIDIEPFPQ